MGSPAKFIRALTGKGIEEIQDNARHYERASAEYKAELS